MAIDKYGCVEVLSLQLMGLLSAISAGPSTAEHTQIIAAAAYLLDHGRMFREVTKHWTMNGYNVEPVRELEEGSLSQILPGTVFVESQLLFARTGGLSADNSLDTIALKLSKVRVMTAMEIPDLVEDITIMCDTFGVNFWPGEVLTSITPQKIISSATDLIGRDANESWASHVAGTYTGTVEWDEVAKFRRNIESISSQYAKDCA